MPFHQRAKGTQPRGVAPNLRPFVLLVISVVLALCAANRWIGWGRDYEQYLVAYNAISPTFTYGGTRFELGYQISAWVFAVILGADFSVFYFFAALTSLLVKFYLFEKYLSKPYLATIAYILLFYPIFEYTQIRAALAISFSYLAVHLLMEKKFLLALILSTLGLLFHSSSFVLVVLVIGVLALPKKLALVATPIAALLLVVVSVVAGEYLAGIFSQINPLIFRYLENDNASQEINVLSLSSILFMATISVGLTFRISQKDEYASKFLILAIFGIVMLFIFKASPVIALRTSEFLLFSTLFFSMRSVGNIPSIVMPSLMILNGVWFTYRAFVEGTLGS